MPSKDELCVLEQSTNRTIIAHDVEQLVSELKENLRLNTVSLKARPSYSRQSRPSPYRVPCRSWSEPVVCDNCMKFNRNITNCQHCSIRHKTQCQSTQEQSDDPYEMLQALIKSQSLIKEAVRRLQFGLASTSTSTATTKKQYLYDSDDECRTPPANSTVLQQICGVEII